MPALIFSSPAAAPSCSVWLWERWQTPGANLSSCHSADKVSASLPCHCNVAGSVTLCHADIWQKASPPPTLCPSLCAFHSPTLVAHMAVNVRAMLRLYSNFLRIGIPPDCFRKHTCLPNNMLLQGVKWDISHVGGHYSERGFFCFVFFILPWLFG